MSALRIAATVVALLAIAPSALAFERTMTCGSSFASPLPCLEGETPIPIWWPSQCVGFHINESGSEDFEGRMDVFEEQVLASFQAWDDVEESYLDVHFAGYTNEDRPGYCSCCGPEGNVNFVGFVEEDWRHASAAIALTSVSFDPNTGRILDADIEMNGDDFRFAVVGVSALGNVQDLRNVLTHEAGHFVGLDHTRTDTFTGPGEIQDATMHNSAPPRETDKRDLHPDDIAGLVAAYPLDMRDDAAVCFVANEGYFEAPEVGPPGLECPDDDGGGGGRRGCAVATAAPLGGPAWWLFGLALLVQRRRRR